MIASHLLSPLFFLEQQLAYSSVVIGALVVCLVCLFWPTESTKRAPPAPNFGVPRIGDAAAFLADPVSFVQKATQKCGSIFQIKLLVANLVYLRGVKLNRMYTDVKEDTWSFGGGIGLFLRKIAKPGYFDHLRTLVNSLNRGVNRKAALEHYFQLIEEEAGKALQGWSQRGAVPVFEETSRFVHRVIVRCLMGQDFYDHHLDELYEILHHMEADIGHPFNLLLPEWIPHPAARRLEQNRDRFAQIFEQQVADRRRNLEIWRDSLDYISFTLEDPRTAHLEGYLPSHHTVLMFAAHTSTVASISWTILELLRNPDYLAQLRQSLATHPDARKCPELLAGIKETGRHYSGVHMFRTTHRAVELEGGKYLVPPNWIVSISPYLTHHDPEIFHTPQEWIPERWLQPDDRMQNLNNPREAAFLQFGAGCHRCPGEALAGIIAQGLLATLVRRYDLFWGKEGPPTDLTALDFSKVGSPWLEGDASIAISPKVAE
ncbi:cytochrome P450 [Aspergillus fijiensis CBS 313.89]|uniref:Cytochrome P450 n=1 Tax=Aspergillus fijiensis CBS 313.89 TaxID=1448319 RepID=A0A8G1VYY6_9EURO|nr:cytochrome P450 [Aspergillus fijiensis CBS 313.89]RAK74479.1 cytochrome P450 [Aspergillus fijiensis CBS 313.89]